MTDLDGARRVLARQLLATLDRDTPPLARIDDYVQGRHDDLYMSALADDEYRLLARRCISNWMPLLVSTPAQAPQQGGAGGRQLGQFGLERGQLLAECAELLVELARGHARNGLASGDHLKDRCRVTGRGAAAGDGTWSRRPSRQGGVVGSGAMRARTDGKSWDRLRHGRAFWRELAVLGGQEQGVTQQLRARIRAGDTAAFGEAFDEHARVVYRHAVRVDGGHAGAEDVVSLTFLEAWRVRDTLRPDGGSVLPWLLGIATNVLRNRRRAASRHRAAMLRVPPAASVPDFADEVVARMHDAEKLAAAAAALKCLSRIDREVFLVAARLRGDCGGARYRGGHRASRLSRARTRLRGLAEAEMARVRNPREPATRAGQVLGDRTVSVRSGPYERSTDERHVSSRRFPDGTGPLAAPGR